MDFQKFIADLKTNIKKLLDDQILIINTSHELEEDYLEVPGIDLVTDEYPDTVRNTQNVVLYLLPSIYNYEFLTNESREQQIDLKLYLTVKGKKHEDLKTIVYRYMQALYTGLDENNSLFGLVDMLYIESIRFYDEIEGTQNYKAFEATIKIILET
jgi:hypothetical protein